MSMLTENDKLEKASKGVLSIIEQMYKDPDILAGVIERNYRKYLFNNLISGDVEPRVNLADIPVVKDGEIYIGHLRVDFNTMAGGIFLDDIYSILKEFTGHEFTPDERLRREKFYNYLGSCH